MACADRPGPAKRHGAAGKLPQYQMEVPAYKMVMSLIDACRHTQRACSVCNKDCEEYDEDDENGKDLDDQCPIRRYVLEGLH